MKTVLILVLVLCSVLGRLPSNNEFKYYYLISSFVYFCSCGAFLCRVNEGQSDSGSVCFLKADP